MNRSTPVTADGSFASLRRILQLTQPRLAAELGISLTLVRKLESGELPLSALVRRRLRAVYGAVVENGEVLNEAGEIYTLEFFECRCRIAERSLRTENLWSALEHDLLLLLNAARDESKVHVLLPRLHDFLQVTREELQLTAATEALRSRSVSAGEIRAHQRSLPVRRRLARLQAREETELQLPEAKQNPAELLELRRKILVAEEQLERIRSRTSVRGRRRSIGLYEGQLVQVSPSDPNEKVFVINSAEFSAWWDRYCAQLGDALINEPDAEEEGAGRAAERT